jgi:hypothetical protein
MAGLSKTPVHVASEVQILARMADEHPVGFGAAVYVRENGLLLSHHHPEAALSSV